MSSAGSSAAPFGTVLTAMVTPVDADGAVDLEKAQKVAKHLIDNGHDGLVLSGTTGESPTTTVEEDGQLLRAVREAVGADIPLVAGIGTNDTRTTLQLAAQAEANGADGLLLVTPYYSKLGQRGLLHHFKQVADATTAPVTRPPRICRLAATSRSRCPEVSRTMRVVRVPVM